MQCMCIITISIRIVCTIPVQSTRRTKTVVYLFVLVFPGRMWIFFHVLCCLLSLTSMHGCRMMYFCLHLQTSAYRRVVSMFFSFQFYLREELRLLNSRFPLTPPMLCLHGFIYQTLNRDVVNMGNKQCVINEEAKESTGAEERRRHRHTHHNYFYASNCIYC